MLELTRPGIDVPLHGPILFALQLAATIALADLSYRYVEQPFRRSTSWQHPIGCASAVSGSRSA